MHENLASDEGVALRQEIISRCTWSDTYSSLKHILKRTANQLPLLISFLDPNEDPDSTNINSQTVLFFDRNLSNKLLFTPLRQRSNDRKVFDVHPNHCTFVLTDAFKGLFEFVSNGHRCTQIFPNLEQLVRFASNLRCTIVFMSRRRAVGFFQDGNTSQWTSKEYEQGTIFRAERIHRSTNTTTDGQRIPNDYLECHDEDGYTAFLKLDQNGRYSIIATSDEQQTNRPELYLHSTQAPNIAQLITTIKIYNDNQGKTNCIRLVRAPVPYNFYCQYFHFVRQHQHDVLVGLTQEGLVVEWNLDSHVPCRYATNLNDILDNIYGTAIEHALETQIDQARAHYRDHFQYDMQLISAWDWTAFFQYWKWNGSSQRKHHDESQVTYQSQHRFHLLASIQDLSDYSQTFISAFRKSRIHSDNSNSSLENTIQVQPNQRSRLFQMSKLLSTPKHSRKSRLNRSSRNVLHGSGWSIFSNASRPFDNSIYDSNPTGQFSSKSNAANRSIPQIKRSKA